MISSDHLQQLSEVVFSFFIQDSKYLYHIESLGLGKKVLAPKPIPRLDLGFGCRYRNQVSVVHYIPVSDFVPKSFIRPSLQYTQSRGMLKIHLFQSCSVLIIPYSRISNFSAPKFWIQQSYFCSEIFRKISQCVHHSIAFSALYIYKKVCCKL